MKYLINLVIILIVISAMAQLAFTQAIAERELEINSLQLKPAVFYWKTGVNRPGELSLMQETIFPAVTGNGQRVWRVIHYPSNPLEAKSLDYDMYDMDFRTLRPIVSDMKNAQFDYKIEFGPTAASLDFLNKTDSVKKQYPISIPRFVYGEGPATQPLVAALPLKENFSTRYYSIDRWRGEGKDKLVLYELKVVGKDQLKLENGRLYKTFVVEVTSENGLYIKKWVLARKPHYQLKVEYMRAPNAFVTLTTNNSIMWLVPLGRVSWNMPAITWNAKGRRVVKSEPGGKERPIRRFKSLKQLKMRDLATRSRGRY